jgi:hypothetical protein
MSGGLFLVPVADLPAAARRRREAARRLFRGGVGAAREALHKPLVNGTKG